MDLIFNISERSMNTKEKVKLIEFVNFDWEEEIDISKIQEVFSVFVATIEKINVLQYASIHHDWDGRRQRLTFSIFKISPSLIFTTSSSHQAPESQQAFRISQTVQRKKPSSHIIPMCFLGFHDPRSWTHVPTRRQRQKTTVLTTHCPPSTFQPPISLPRITS